MRKSVYQNRSDEYHTPAYAVELLLSYIPNNIKTIWCPCDTEESKFVKVLRNNGYNVISSHINSGNDFLEYEPEENYDAIITNPPFSIKNKIIERCIKLNKPFALLLSATCLQSKSLIEILSKCNDFNFIMINERIRYTDERPSFPSWYFTNNFLKSNQFYLLDLSNVE